MICVSGSSCRKERFPPPASPKGLEAPRDSGVGPELNCGVRRCLFSASPPLHFSAASRPPRMQETSWFPPRVIKRNPSGLLGTWEVSWQSLRFSSPLCSGTCWANLLLPLVAGNFNKKWGGGRWGGGAGTWEKKTGVEKMPLFCVVSSLETGQGATACPTYSVTLQGQG